MSKIVTTTVTADDTNTLTIGETGDSVNISGDSLNVNALQDAGGNAIFTSDGSGTVTAGSFPGSMKLISTQTASGAASVSFTSGLDSTYDVYLFRLFDINGTSDSA